MGGAVSRYLLFFPIRNTLSRENRPRFIRGVVTHTHTTRKKEIFFFFLQIFDFNFYFLKFSANLPLDLSSVFLPLANYFPREKYNVLGRLSDSGSEIFPMCEWRVFFDFLGDFQNHNPLFPPRKKNVNKIMAIKTLSDLYYIYI